MWGNVSSACAGLDESMASPAAVGGKTLKFWPALPEISDIVVSIAAARRHRTLQLRRHQKALLSYSLRPSLYGQSLFSDKGNSGAAGSRSRHWSRYPTYTEYDQESRISSYEAAADWPLGNRLVR